MHHIPSNQLVVSVQWFRLIVANRPNDGEDVSTLTSVNDIRNAMLLGYEPHKLFDKRKLVVLKVAACSGIAAHPSHIIIRHPISYLLWKMFPLAMSARLARTSSILTRSVTRFNG
jgi:hypothetical protein